jgi:general secretion pathway protein H
MMPTCRTKSRPTPRARAALGFTLLELVIVVALAAFIATIGINRIGGQKAKIQASVRKLGTLIKDIKYKSKLEGATFRLAIEISAKDAPLDLEDKDRKSRYWVEKAPGSVLLGQDAEKEAEKKAAQGDKKDAPPDPNAFQPDPRLLKRPEDLPSGLFFTEVEFAKTDKPVTSGIAYIYFLPEGYVDEVAIHFKNIDNLQWTLMTRPLTGKVDAFQENKKLSDLGKQ